MSHCCAFDLHMALPAWNLFYYSVCVCVFPIFAKHDAGNKIMPSLTPVYISVIKAGHVTAKDSAANTG